MISQSSEKKGIVFNNSEAQLALRLEGNKSGTPSGTVCKKNFEWIKDKIEKKNLSRKSKRLHVQYRERGKF